MTVMASFTSNYAQPHNLFTLTVVKSNELFLKQNLSNT